MAALIQMDARGESEDGKDVNANTPDRSTAAAFPRYLTGEVVADSVALHWPGLYARRWRLPRVVDRFLVPATPEPHISCNLRGVAEFRERDVGGRRPAGETVPTMFSTDDTFDVGEDWGTPVSHDYKCPAKFTGTMKSVTVEVK